MPPATSKTPPAAATAAPKKGRKSASLPPETVDYLKAWMMSPEHVSHPYPTEQEKAQIMRDTGIELKQLTNWFVNNRKRFWKPRVDAIKLQKKKGSPGTPVARGEAGGNPWVPAPRKTKDSKAPREATVPAPAPPSHSSPAPALLGPQNQSKSFGPTSGVILPVNGPNHEDDLHTISDVSGSSACNSDDESIAASSNHARPPAFGTTSARYLGSRLSNASGSAVLDRPGPSPVHGGGCYRRHEEIDVHVVRPEGCVSGGDLDPLPTLRDVTIKSSVPNERMLATFKCPISYTVPYKIEHDSKKVQSRRDREILRVKKHYLNLYLATRGVHNAVVGFGARSAAILVTPPVAVATTDHTAPAPRLPLIVSRPAFPGASPRTPSFPFADLERNEDKLSLSPRKRARVDRGQPPNGEEEWRSLCQNAKSVYCESLPGLDEAARMFGYVSQ